MKRIKIDFRDCVLRYELHLELKRALKAPKWYGMNLDALNDLLGEINEPTVFVFKGAKHCRDFFGAYGESLFSVFANAAEEYPLIIIKELP